jgi:hypothetical protein
MVTVYDIKGENTRAFYPFWLPVELTSTLNAEMCSFMLSWAEICAEAKSPKPCTFLGTQNYFLQKYKNKCSHFFGGASRKVLNSATY